MELFVAIVVAVATVIGTIGGLWLTHIGNMHFQEQNRILIAQHEGKSGRPENAPSPYRPPKWPFVTVAILMLMTWSAAGYDYYDRHHSTWNESKLERVYNRTFTNETVELDNKYFINPTFDNVTFAYNGLGPFGWDKATWKTHDSKLYVQTESRNPVVNNTSQLLVAIAQASGCQAFVKNLGPGAEATGVTPAEPNK